MIHCLRRKHFLRDSRPGRPDAFVKNSPKNSPNTIFVKSNAQLLCTVVNSSLIIRAISFIFTKLPKVNSRPIGEKSPNLVTLISTKERRGQPAPEQ
jgi:hypothetical protein